MHQSGHNQIRHHFFRVRYTELNEIFAYMSLRSFAIALISIFIPIYLYKMGFTLAELMLFYVSIYVVELLAEYLVANLIKKVGPKHLMALSIPLLITHFAQLLTLNIISWPILSMGITGGLALSLFWQSYHYDFSRSKHREKTSAEIGKLYIVNAVLGASAPFIGGFIATKFNISWVFTTAIILFIIAVAVLFKTKDNNFRRGTLTLSNIRIREIARDLLAYGGSTIEVSSAGVIWPLFLFLLVKSYESVGAITSAALVVTVVVTYYISKKSDQGKRITYLKIGGLLNGIISIIKAFTASVLQAYGVSVAKSFASSIQAAPFCSEYYIHADEEKRSEYIFLMESAVDLARISFFLLLFGLSFVLPIKTVLVTGLVIGGFGAFLSTIMPPAKCEICGPIKNKRIKLTPRPVKR
jgi:hypothetical protein